MPAHDHHECRQTEERAVGDFPVAEQDQPQHADDQAGKGGQEEDHQARLPAEIGADHGHQRDVAEAHRLAAQGGRADDRAPATPARRWPPCPPAR